jgi:uncharacterized iron-regulated membrane protein
MSWGKFRAALQTVHLWAGLALSIPFILIGVSGSLLVLLADLPSFEIPTASARGAPQPLGRIIEAASRFAPDGWTAGAVVLPRKPGEPAGVEFQLPPGRRPIPALRNLQARVIYVDPVSLKILGGNERRRAGAFRRSLTAMHIALMVPNYYGARLVGWMGVAMVLFGLTGLVLWWPRRGTWGQAFGVKRGARGFRLHRDLHAAIGFWSLGVFLLVSLSGVYLAFPVTISDAAASLTPVQMPPREPAADPATLARLAGPGSLSPDGAVKLALASVPRAEATEVQLPARGSGVYMVTLEPDPYGWDAPQISVFIGPGAQVTDIVDPRVYGWGKRVLVWMRAMHYGEGLGIVWHVMVFLSGFLPLLFAITGLRMWQLKRAQRRTFLGVAPQPAE